MPYLSLDDAATASCALRTSNWFLAGVCDGINVTPLLTPGGVTEFVDFIVSELQRRKLFHEDYASTSLRQYLGIGDA